jgi:hypothetical protein
MGAEKPTVLIIGPQGDSALGISRQLLESGGIEVHVIASSTDAVDLAIAGTVDTLIYWKADDLTGPETFEAIRWGYSTAGFIYIHAENDPLKDRIIEDVRAIKLQMPFTLRNLMKAVATVSPACKLAFEGGRAPA